MSIYKKDIDVKDIRVYLSLVALERADVVDYNSGKDTSFRNIPTKALEINGHMVFPENTLENVLVEFPDMRPQLRNRNIDSRNYFLFEDHCLYSVALVYPFKEMKIDSCDDIDDLRRNHRDDHLGLKFDIRDLKMQEYINAQEEFSKILEPYDIKLRSGDVYFRFFVG